MLSGYRVLDMTDEKGVLCGKLLGDLGADVIKVERPGGDPARNIGPFYHDEAQPDRSLFWFAFNTNKRGITLNIETSQGQEIFKRLAVTADFVVESFAPGYLDKLGLGYSALEKINPGVIMVSIAPFGQCGPYKDYSAPDIVAWAMGGQMYPWGDVDRPPIRISHHSHAHLHAAAEAAVGALVALYRRGITGRGQHVDVSIQESIAQVIVFVTPWWDMMKVVERRGAMLPKVRLPPQVWRCKDGFVMWTYFGGAGGNRRDLPLIKWMEDEGMADDFLRGMDWDAWDMRTTTQEVVDKIVKPTAAFFISHTKAELLEGAVRHKAMVYPTATTADIAESEQLVSREFWVEVEHPELGTYITYPGAFAKTLEASLGILRRAPATGEHNQEIYENELGIPRKELVLLKQAGVI